MQVARDRDKAIALGWIAGEAPGMLASGLVTRVHAWAEGTEDAMTLWQSLIDRLHLCGAFDAEISLLGLVQELVPDNPALDLRLALMLARSGQQAESRTLLAQVAALAETEGAALRQMLSLEMLEPVFLDRLIARLDAERVWSAAHERVISILVAQDGPAKAESLLDAWGARFSGAPGAALGLGTAWMELGKPERAAALLEPLWQAGGGLEALIGSPVEPPFDAGVETLIAGRIENAPAAPPAAPLALPPSLIPGQRVMMVSFTGSGLDNDMAVHLERSAAEAGLALRLHLDDALVLPARFPGGDSMCLDRIRQLEAALAAFRPHLVVLDCCWPLQVRGLNPEVMAGLKGRFGFRLVGMMRDSHAGLMPRMAVWATVCEQLLVFNPATPALADPALKDRIVFAAVPCFHQMFTRHAGAPRTLPLCFAGSLNWKPRVVLLAVLATRLQEMTMITGPQRKARLPDMAAYAGLLGMAGAVLNIAHHGPGADDRLITGRVWESLAAGALLLEQENAATASMLVPWRHYLPWRNLGDIVNLTRFARARPDLAAQVAAEGHAFAMARHHPSAWWGALLASVDAAPPCPQPLPGGWFEATFGV